MVTIHYCGQTIFSFTHIESIPLDAGEKVDEIAEGTSDMDVDKVSEIGGRASEGQAAWMYGTSFAARALARVGTRNGKWVQGITVGSDEEFTEVRRT